MISLREDAREQDLNGVADGSPTSPGVAALALMLIALSMAWYVSQVARFGFELDRVDLIGGYLATAGAAVVVAWRTPAGRIGRHKLLALACALTILATVIFLGQFLSTFDPFYRVSNRLFPYVLRAVLLGAAVMTLLALGPGRFFRCPRWLVAVSALLVAGWLFVYASPSVVREWYGTRTEPSAIFPRGMLVFPRPNPERRIQRQLFAASSLALVVTIAAGRIRYWRDVRAAAPADG